MDHFTGLWDEPTARPLEVWVGAGVEVAAREAVPVGAVVGPDAAAGAVGSVDRLFGPEVFRVAGREFWCAAVEPVLPVEWPVPDGESGAVTRGVSGCAVSGWGKNGELTLGAPSIVLISSAT
ncbi:hypothetical protein [Streptomyces sp. NPDC046197]|uniref:hypothetical protein n=1 Tax=Streptomyces sp. NPDC046197 TaxID=3154337 RepID=UPI0033FF0432